MLRVGLTGGIATGKSTVGQMFIDLGCHLIDSDEITHHLLEPHQAVHAAIVQAFGDGILRPDGSIDRKILGGIIFNNTRSRAMLNDLIHPAIIQRQQEWLNQMEREDPQGIGIVSAALMVEIGTYKTYDKVIVVSCSPEKQRERLRARAGLAEEEIDARIGSQMPIEEKVKYGDYVIDTSGEFSDTWAQVKAVNSKLRESAAGISGSRRS